MMCCIKLVTASALLCLVSTAFAQNNASSGVGSDSTVHEQKKAASWRVVGRVNTAGFFNFSGRICSHNPAGDLTFSYEKKGWGVTVFLVKDLHTTATENNFAFPLLYKKIHFGKRLTVTPNVGYVARPWSGDGGDRLIILTAYKITSKITVDETALLANLIQKNNHEWVNRLRLSYGYNAHLQVIGSLWYNTKVLDPEDYVSGAIHLGYNHIPVAHKLDLNLAAGYLYMAKSSDEVNTPMVNGFIFTAGLSLN